MGKLKTKTKTAEKISKAKTNQKAKAIAAASAVVDDAISVNAEIKLLQAKIKELQKNLAPIEVGILDAVEPHLADDEKLELFNPAETNSIQIRAKRNSRSISDKEALVDMLEDQQEGLAFEIASFGISAIDKHLTSKEMDQVCEIIKGKRAIAYS